MSTSSAIRFADVGGAAWRVVPLGEATEIVSGFGFPKHLQGKQEGDLPFFKVGDISAAWNSGQKLLSRSANYISQEQAKSIRAKAFPRGTVVFAKIGEAIKLNRRAILREPSIVDNNVMGLISRPELVDELYLYYWTLTVKLGELSQATTVPSVRKSDVEQLEFPLAPLEQQRYIVAEIEKQFSRLDEAVASLKRVKANLKRYKAAVLKAAVEGKLTEDWRKQHPDVEPARKLLERILAERRAKWSRKSKYKEPDGFNPPDLPLLPPHWTWASLDQLFQNITDGDHQPPPQTEEGVPFLVIGNVRSGKIEFEGTRFVSRQYANSVDVFRKPIRGDILYTLVGSFGIALPVETDREFCIQRHIGILRPHRLTPTYYVVYVLKSSFVFNQATNVATGTAQKTVPLAGLRSFAVPLAPLTEQQKIVAEVELRLSIIDELESTVETNLTRADRLRQSVLQQAFSGRLVPENPNVGSASASIAPNQSDNLQIEPKTTRSEREAIVQEGVEAMANLFEALTRANDWISAQEAFRHCGIGGGAETDAIERLYEELRSHIDSGRIVVNRRGESDWLRLSEHQGA